jgi:hypothetical protein
MLTGQNTLVSAAGDGTPANQVVLTGTNYPLIMSADGRFVVFTSAATNLVAQPINDLRTHMFLRNSSLIVLMSLRQLFLGELHSCIARLRFAGRSIFSSAGYLSTSFYECGESRLDLDGPAQANY